jgi:ligand-binding sensor domain-containing protein
MRALGATTLLLAMLVTLWPPGVPVAAVGFGSDAAARSHSRWAPRVAAQEQSPLDGHWRTLANGDRVQTIVRDGDTLWVGTEAGGLVKWDVEHRSYVQYLSPQRDLPSNDVFDVAFAPQGRLWLATGGGLALFDPDRETFEIVTPDTSPGMPARVVTAVEPAGDGTLWVGFAQEWDPSAEHPDQELEGAFAQGGLARYEPESGQWTNVQHVTFDDNPSAQPRTYSTIPSENITDLEMTPDGILWIGTRPYYVWEPEQQVPGGSVSNGGEWVLEGGGLAAYDEGEDEWQQWYAREDGSGSCYASEINGLAADSSGRMWVATWGRGVMVMQHGLERVACAGQARYGRAVIGDGGLRGNVVWSIDVDPAGRIWMGHGDNAKDGRGIAILDHNGTIDDWQTPWNTDDTWSYIDFDGVGGKSAAVVTALIAEDPNEVVLGAIDNTDGDGFGVRLLSPATGTWLPLRTADTGMPSNQIKHIAYDAARRHVWFTFRRRGVARLDEGTGAWTWWRAYQNAADVAMVMSEAAANANRVPVSLADSEEYEEAFPGSPKYARFGNDPTLYEVVGYRPARGSDDPSVYVSPRVRSAIPQGVSVYRVARGAPGNVAQHVAVSADGTAWVGADYSIWREGPTPGSYCATYPQCYIDGGLGELSGSKWHIHNDTNSELPTNGVGAVRVGAVEVDLAGRVWAGTGDRRASGDGIGVFDPDTGQWTVHTARTGLKAGDGVADFDVDPATGDVWTAHHPVLGYVTLPGGQQQRYFDGGGVARWDGSGWRSWTKPDASIRAFGDKGILEAVLVDRTRDLVWAGGWDGDPVSYHWPKGRDVHAVVNWCPIDDCDDGDWQHRAWEDEGTVGALEIDDQGRVWVGTNRDGAGVVPAENGVKLFDGQDWYVITPTNSGLPHREVSALAAAGDRMLVGTLRHGVGLYIPGPAPTATPTATLVPPTHTPSPTASPTDEATPTSIVTPSATASQSPIAKTPSATTTATPAGPQQCPPDGTCRVFAPFAVRGR